MFGWFKGNPQKGFDKHGDTLKNQVTTKEMRLEAIEILADGPPEFAIPQLLKRFELSVEHGLQDNKEKERVAEVILGWPEQAKPFVLEILKTKKRIAWPIRLVERLWPEPAEHVGLLLAELRPEEAGFNETQQERNIELLLALKDCSDPRIADSVIPFVSLRDESVRMAALECLEQQAGGSPRLRDFFVGLSRQEPTDENSRLIGLVRGIVERHRWNQP